MNKSEIERLLRNASEGFTPEVFPQIIEKKHNPLTKEYHFNKRENVVSLQKKRIMVALAFLLIISLSIGIFFGIMNQDNEVVYLEINPSLKIVTNRFNRIKEITYLNHDAEELFEGQKVKNIKLDEIVELFIDLSYDRGYLEQNHQINIFVESIDEEKAELTAQRLQNKASKRAVEKNVEPNINASKITKEEAEEAEESHIPMEKLVVIRQILEMDENQNREELEEKSVKELRDIFKAYKQSKNEDNSENINNPGQGDDPPGQGDNPPGQGDNPPGQGDNPPGQGDNPPGQGGSPEDNPGQGNPPSNPGQENPGQGNPPSNPGQENPGQGNPPSNPGQGNNPA